MAHNPARSIAITAALVMTLVLGFQSYALLSLSTEVEDLRTSHDAVLAELQVVSGEVTRFRVEQSAEGQGPQALLEKLQVYAPLLSNARVVDPESGDDSIGERSRR